MSSVFEPTQNNYLNDYPELRKIEDFKNLSEEELRFVFYFYSQSSPFFKNSRQDRIIKSIDIAFSGKLITFNQREIPPHIETAGQRMAKFNVALRTQADIVVRQMFYNIKAVSSIPEKQVMSMDVGEKKQYVEMSLKVSETLPNLVKLLEEGFGTHPVGEFVEKEDLPDGMSLADKVMEQEKRK